MPATTLGADAADLDLDNTLGGSAQIAETTLGTHVALPLTVHQARATAAQTLLRTGASTAAVVGTTRSSGGYSHFKMAQR